MLSCSRIASRCIQPTSLLRSQAGLGRSFAVSKVTIQVGFPSNSASVRFLSTKDLFGSVDLENAALDIPVLQPPIPKPSIEELVSAGQSVLNELGLWTWWKPTSYFRWALESFHVNFDVPWWGTILCATLALRLAFFFVPVMSHKMMAIQNQYKPHLDVFRKRMDAARSEGNNGLVQQVYMEQRDFMLSKGIRMGRQTTVMMLNSSVFLTQFFAIKKMIAVGYPGFSQGGALWFTDFTVIDPFVVLPLLSAASMFLVFKLGTETGSGSDQMPPVVRLGMQYGMPLIIFAAGTQMPAGIVFGWVISNGISLGYAALFKVPAVRRLFSIPELIKHPSGPAKNAFAEVMHKYKTEKNAPPTMDQIRKKDAENFKKAGRAKPAIKVESSQWEKEQRSA